MGRERRRYVSYLLRLWQVGSRSEVVWRASLQDPRTGDRTGFPSLEALFSFLRHQTDVIPLTDGTEGDTEGQSERK